MQKTILLLALTCFTSRFVIAQSNITRVEYFFNTDPGFGRGTPIPITPAVNIQDWPVTIPVNNLPPGLQTLFIRSANANNVWSVTNNLLFLKTTLPPAANITAAEYFIDADPGFGNAFPIPVTRSADIPDKSVPVNISSITSGLHTLFIRSKDANGKWSITNNFLFLKTGLPPAANVVTAEYFIDADPGFDHATPAGSFNATNVPDMAVPVNISNITAGLHQFGIRSKNTDGKWSITNFILFYKTSNQLTSINQAEYFIDTDPGFGYGTPLPLNQSSNVSDVSYSIDIKNIDTGMHKFFIRSKGTDDKWSITNYLQFRKSAALPLTLLSFEAVALSSQVMLQWETANEQNTSHFDIEYSTDGSGFSKISQVTAKGYSSSTTTYTFLHSSPSQNNVNYYRLKQIDKDGKFVYSPIRTAKFTTNKNFAIDPNPVLNNLTIYTTEEGLTVHIFESAGKKLMSQKITGHVTSLNFSFMATGIYYVVAERNGTPVYTQKVLKQ